jgi:hypothetical protein
MNLPHGRMTPSAVAECVAQLSVRQWSIPITTTRATSPRLAGRGDPAGAAQAADSVKTLAAALKGVAEVRQAEWYPVRKRDAARDWSLLPRNRTPRSLLHAPFPSRVPCACCASSPRRCGHRSAQRAHRLRTRVRGARRTACRTRASTCSRRTATGYIWAGTEAGPYRFDGVRFTAWARAHERGCQAAGGTCAAWCVRRQHVGRVWRARRRRRLLSRHGPHLRPGGRPASRDGVDARRRSRRHHWAELPSASTSFTATVEHWGPEKGVPPGPIAATYVTRDHAAAGDSRPQPAAVRSARAALHRDRDAARRPACDRRRPIRHAARHRPGGRVSARHPGAAASRTVRAGPRPHHRARSAQQPLGRHCGPGTLAREVRSHASLFTERATA